MDAIHRATETTEFWYGVKTVSDGYLVTKFDEHIEVVKVYRVFGHLPGKLQCTCPQGERGNFCKHRNMIMIFFANKRMDQGHFYDWDFKRWHGPLMT